MYSYSKRSRNNLSTCDRSLQAIFNEVIKYYDVSIICGHRTEDAQEKAFKEGNSTKEYPDSNHNSFPSRAVDVVPYPIDWDDTNRFYQLSGVVFTIAEQLRIPIVWGGNWSTIIDMPHWELK